MNFRYALAHEIADQIEALVLPLRCERCTSPMMGKPEQDFIPFCWSCVTDKRTAADGRKLLIQAQLAAKGILLNERHQTHFYDGPPL